MPYRTIRDLPAQFDGVPEHGKRIALNVINSMLANGATEERAFAAAWSQIKKKYEKKNGKWVAKAKESRIAEAGWRETETSYRYRIRSPEDFDQDTFRTKKMPGVSGITMVLGKLHGHDEMTLQALIFDKDVWTLDDAKAWLAKHEDLTEAKGGGNPLKTKESKIAEVIAAFRTLAGELDETVVAEVGKTFNAKNWGIILQILALIQQLVASGGSQSTEPGDDESGVPSDDKPTKTKAQESGKTRIREAITDEDKAAIKRELEAMSRKELANVIRRISQHIAAGNTFTGFTQADMEWFLRTAQKIDDQKAVDAGEEKPKHEKVSYSEAAVKEIDEIDECMPSRVGQIRDRAKKSRKVKESLPGTLEALQDEIRSALNDPNISGFCGCWRENNTTPTYSTLYLEGTTLDGKVYVRCYRCNKWFIANYGRNEQGDITFSDIKQAVEIIKPVVESPAEETGIDEAAVPLRESAGMTEDGIIEDACLIKVGWGACGYYDAEMLRQEASKFNGAQMFIDHPTPIEEAQQPERTLKALAGVVIGNCKFNENGWRGPGVYGPIKVFSDYREPIREKAPYIGLSVYGKGKARIGEAEGRTGKIIQSLDIRSVDFVTLAGAGGALPIIESAREELRKKARPKDLKSATLADLREVRPDLVEAIEVEIRESQSEGGQKPMGDQELVQLKETVTQLKETVTQLEEKNKKQELENAKLRESVLLRDAGDEADLLLKEAKIPDITKARIRRECLLSIPVAEGGGLDKAKFQEMAKAKIAEAEAEFAAIVGSGRVVGLGGGSGPTNIKESVAGKLNKMFGIEEEKKTGSEQK